MHCRYSLCDLKLLRFLQPGEQGDAYVAHISDTGTFYVIWPGQGVKKLDDLIEELTSHFAKVKRFKWLIYVFAQYLETLFPSIDLKNSCIYLTNVCKCVC